MPRSRRRSRRLAADLGLLVVAAAFVIERSAAETIVSVSVAELFAGVASVSHEGTATVAVFASEQEEALTVPVTV